MTTPQHWWKYDTISVSAIRLDCNPPAYSVKVEREAPRKIAVPALACMLYAAGLRAGTGFLNGELDEWLITLDA